MQGGHSAFGLPCCCHLRKACHHPPHKPRHSVSHLLFVMVPGGRRRPPSPESGPGWCWVPAVGVVQPTEATPLFLLSHVLMASQHDVVSGRSGNIFGKYLLTCDGSRGFDDTLLLPMYMVFIMTPCRPTSAGMA